MVEHNIDYFDVARTEIETAIDLFNAGNWICAHVLCHAATGVLEKFSENHVFKDIQAGVVKELCLDSKSAAGLIRKEYNAFKHGPYSAKGGKMDIQDIYLDNDKVVGAIFLSICQYWQSTSKVTQNMQSFCDIHVGKYA